MVVVVDVVVAVFAVIRVLFAVIRAAGVQRPTLISRMNNSLIPSDLLLQI